MKILYVAYPLLPVSENSAGGAEQMLWTLEREVAQWRMNHTGVAACAGSQVSGELIATGDEPRANDIFEQRAAEHCARVVEEVLRREGTAQAFDIVHDKSGHFWRCAGALNTPVLVTLHLPRNMYRAEVFEGVAENVYFNCVSNAQAASFGDLPRFMGVVQNGIALERFVPRRAKGDYLLWIGRICEEKGPQIAIDVAEESELPLTMAGALYPFSYHQQFFTREIVPRLGSVNYIEWPSFEQKLRLLQNARAVLLTSLTEETSSLVAMEAMACGTPVVAFRRGAFPEVIADGETGFICDDVDAMVDAVKRVNEIDPAACRRRVERFFSAKSMALDYERLYETVLSKARLRSTEVA